MAFLTARKNGTWELRESVSTPDGPRSRTLASFRTLSDDVIEHAQARATRPLDGDEIRDLARRAGAPVDLATADRAAGILLRELSNGQSPHPILRTLLIDALQDAPPTRLDEASAAPKEETVGENPLPLESLDSARASAAWLTATPTDRGAALYDLLLLADQFPNRRRTDDQPSFPHLNRAA